MRVAGHQHILVLLAEGLKTVEKALYGLGYGAQLVAHKQFEVDEYLVVARAAGVDFLAEVAETLGKKKFHLGVYVLDIVLDAELSGFDGVQYLLQPGKELVELVLFQKPDGLEHLDVGHGALHVVSGEAQVEVAVVAYGEFFNQSVRLEAFVPEFCHNNK